MDIEVRGTAWMPADGVPARQRSWDEDLSGSKRNHMEAGESYHSSLELPRR